MEGNYKKRTLPERKAKKEFRKKFGLTQEKQKPKIQMEEEDQIDSEDLVNQSCQSHEKDVHPIKMKMNNNSFRTPQQ